MVVRSGIQPPLEMMRVGIVVEEDRPFGLTIGNTPLMDKGVGSSPNGRPPEIHNHRMVIQNGAFPLIGGGMKNLDKIPLPIDVVGGEPPLKFRTMTRAEASEPQVKKSKQIMSGINPRGFQLLED